MNRDAERLAALLDDWMAGHEAEPEAGEWADLVAAASAVRSLEHVPPPPHGLHGGRAAFIAAGVRGAGDRRGRARVGLLGGLWARYRLAPVALAMAAVALGGAVTTAQAQASLPGDILYPVKRLTETVQVAFVRGEQREWLQLELQQRRRDEAVLLLARERTETVRFEGRVERLADGRVTVAGLVVDVGQLGGPDFEPGALVAIEGVTGPDGVVHARRVGVLALAPAERPAQPMVALPAATQDPRSFEPEPTPTSRPVTATPQPAVATPVPTAVPTEPLAPTEAPTQVAAAPPVRERQIVEWEGPLERVGPEWWIVAGQAVYRPTGRVVGDALLCSWVRVRAERRRDRLELVELRVLRAAAKPEVVTVQGTIEAIEAEAWVIDGQRILVTSDTVIEGEGQPGRPVRATVQVDACGRRVAQRLVVDAPRLVEFVGVIESYSPTLWVVAGRSLQVTPTTAVRGFPWVGATVWVRAELSDGGLLVARELVVRDEPPTATPTATIGASPTAGAVEPSPTETPAAAPTAHGTVGP